MTKQTAARMVDLLMVGGSLLVLSLMVLLVVRFASRLLDLPLQVVAEGLGQFITAVVAAWTGYTYRKKMEGPK